MEESLEMQDLQGTTQFGRWADMDEWFKETCNVKEKTRPSKEVKTIPVPGEWCLGIYIPMRAKDYSSAMETAMSLLAAMGTRPKDAYLERGYCVLWLKPAESYEAKALAVQVRRWLVSRAFKTTVGGYPDEWRAGVPAHLMLEQDNRNYAKESEELSMVKRLRAKLTGSMENLTLVLTRGQVEALIDLVGQYKAERITFEQSIDDYVQDFYHIEEGEWQLKAETSQILQPLAKLSGALGTVLRSGSTDSRGPLSRAKRPTKSCKVSKKSKPACRDLN